ncbi:MAG: glycosyltransferase family 4 protein [Vicinamibacterales bacterium]
MRILFLAQVLPLPLDAGPKIRAYYVLRHLAEAGHQVTLVSFVRPGDRADHLESLARLCHEVVPVPLTRSRVKDIGFGLRAMALGRPFLIERDRLPAMDARLRALASGGSFDAVHADQLWMAPFAARCSDIPVKVLDQHNAVFRVPQRLAAGHRNPLTRALLGSEAGKLERFERDIMREFGHVVWVSAEDRDAFPSIAAEPWAQTVIPIAVDPAERAPVARPRPFRVTFLGGLHWPPNAEGVRWFLDEVWPLVAAAVPDAVFTVIGKGSLGRLGRVDLSRVEITGYVDDPTPYLEETAAFVVPLHTGAGMRVKILDAWCWAMPVVSTTVGAEGIRTTDGDTILLADDADAFAVRVIRVLREPALARRLAENGRAAAESLYDWRTTYSAWDAVYH